jgi:hypothetical protein
MKRRTPMPEAVENKYIYVPEPRPQGYTAVCDAVSVSMGLRATSDTSLENQAV